MQEQEDGKNAPPKSLELRASRSGARALIAQAAALFVAAGTLDYWQGWVYVGIQAISIGGTTLYLLRTDRALMDRRLAFEERGEREPVQRLFFALLMPLGFAILVLAALDHRFGWSSVPIAVQIVSQLVTAYGVFLIFLVFRENTYASSVVEVDPQQTVVSSGPYRWVRHPMYTGILVASAAAPLALGSYVATVLFLPLCGLFVLRLSAEERLLAEALPGYKNYMQETRHRLIPGLW